jgi:hypothetical protein
LENLTVTARALAPAAHHRAVVAEARRTGQLGQPRGQDACDLRGHVRAQRDHLSALGLDEAQHFVRIERTETALEHLRVFEHGQRHDLVTVQLEAARDPAGQLGLMASDWR